MGTEKKLQDQFFNKMMQHYGNVILVFLIVCQSYARLGTSVKLPSKSLLNRGALFRSGRFPQTIHYFLLQNLAIWPHNIE